MADDGWDIEGFPKPQEKKRGILRFAAPNARKPRRFEEDLNLYIPHTNTSPRKRQPTFWLGRTSEQIGEDDRYIGARQGAQEDSEEEEFVYRKTKATPPKREPYTQMMYRPAKPAREQVEEDDVVPPPKLRPSGPPYPKSSDEFWSMDKYGRTHVVTYAEIKNMEGRWVRHDAKKHCWYFMRD